MAITNNYIGVITKIYLIRHCKSEDGACSRAQVQTDVLVTGQRKTLPTLSSSMPATSQII